MRLGCIFNHSQTVAPRKLHDRIEVGGLAKKMNRNDGLCSWRQCALERRRIHRIGPLIDIDKDRCGAAKTDRLGGCDKGAGDGDDFVPLPNPAGQQSQPERIGAIADADRMLAAAEGGKVVLKRLDKRAAGEGAGVNHLRDNVLQLGAERRVLRLEIKKRNVHANLSSPHPGAAEPGSRPRWRWPARLESRRCPLRPKRFLPL